MTTFVLKNRCPVDVALDVVGGKWKPLILYRLGAGTLRFGQLQRAIPQVTQRMLTLQLRELERDGLLIRTVYPEVPPKVEYRLTDTGRSVLPLLEALGRWLIEHQGELQAALARHAVPRRPAGRGATPITERLAVTDR